MSKTFTITINSCRECKYVGHTGAFTTGGAKACCNHDETCRTRGYDCFKRVIRNPDNIVAWCPLKSGGKY